MDQSEELEFFWAMKAAEQGDDYAQNTVGTFYSGGISVKKDSETAMQWFRRAAKKKNEEAAYNMAILYEVGDGVEQNYKEALRWYRLADKWGKEGVEEDIIRLKALIGA